MKLFLLTITCFITFFCNGQFIEVKGKILDERGTPVSAATVMCTKAKSVSWANKDGNYSIVTPYNDDTLMCTHISYTGKVEPIEGNTTINFFLQKQSSHSYSVIVTNDCGADQKAANKEHQNVIDSPLVKKWWANRDGDELERVEITSEYPGGQKIFQKDFERFFPVIANRKVTGVGGVIKLGLVIGKDGTVKEVTLIKGIDALYDQAAIKTMESISHWIPAEQNGRKVESYKEVSINFVDKK